MKELVKIVLIPAYEPDGSLIQVLKELEERGFVRVVVDDGSSAKCQTVFDEVSGHAVLLRHEVNKGKGEALKTGMRYIAEHFPEDSIVVTADADGQHTVPDIERITLGVGETPDALVLGSRKMEGKAPLRSRFGNAVTRLVFRLSTGTAVYDTQTGLRGFLADQIPDLLEIPGSRYEYEMNMLLTWAREKKEIREIDIRTVYLNDNASSHFDTVKDSWRVYREIFRFSASSLVGFAVDYILFCLLSLLTGQVLVSNIVARVCSASVNYTLNRRLVFAEKAPVARSLPRYAALAVVILACNTLILKLLTMLGVTAWLAKLATEMLLFAVSFLAQKKLVFTGEVRHENA